MAATWSLPGCGWWRRWDYFWFCFTPIRQAGLALLSVCLYPWVWEQSRILILPFPPPFPPWLVLFPLHTPRCHVLSIVLCSSYCRCRQRSVFPTDHYIKYTLYHLMPSLLPSLLAFRDTRSPKRFRKCSSLSTEMTVSIFQCINSSSALTRFSSCFPHHRVWALVCPKRVPPHPPLNRGHSDMWASPLSGVFRSEETRE